MMEKETMENMQQPENGGAMEQDSTIDISAGPDDSSAQAEAGDPKKELEQLKAQVAEFKEKYLRQVAEFDNFRKRNAKERLELIQTAGKEVITSLLDVLDDCDRAQQQINKSSDINEVREGVTLVFSKLKNSLQAKGLKAMESKGQPFDPDLHEAVTEVPVPSDDMKGKVVDEVQKGYYLNEKIIRHAKVVVGK